ncbi:transcriptional regulator TyrR [Aestuariibacter halophilus]|uniref:HTH-type transcriptional regulatory protein TyrR n=1 Tax=Fluctibacter halophilus TaxID=226011 RepID=A0ABS8G7U8_9ALTE|nr:transcriptional regulator TyrR [Aestuariibacter halophilus]MCC2616667.1 transcriptional regulator TyrR [Aestuariibacter halophilus]
MRLEITCQDRLGITQDVLDILVNYEIDLRGIEIDESGKIFLNFPNIEFADFQHLMPEIRRIEGITDVKTTPFMPLEREQNQLRALLQTLPDPVFSLDTRGRILLVNEAVTASLEMPVKTLLGNDIAEFVRGFNVTRWLDSKQPKPQTQKVKFIEQDFLADILPVVIPDAEGSTILAGALLMLKSEFRLGQQLTVFHQATSDSFSSVLANSAAMKKVVREAMRMSELDDALMIFGETGTGKALLARACHEASRRASGRFVTLQCSALPDPLFEQSLLGTADEPGLLEQAQGGTLFIDDVAEMSPLAQAVLQRVLQQGGYTESSSGETQPLDVRIVCATQHDLGQKVQEGAFREDVYYRLNALSLVVPPLRDRKSDIVPLAERCLKQHSVKLGRRPPKLSKSCVDYLMAYPWPGNVRQLENALYRALSLLQGNELSKEHIQLPSAATSVSIVPEDFEGSLEDEVKRFEKDLLKRLYPYYPSTRQLAKKLGLSHTAIANKLREYDINKKTVKL